MIFIGRPHDCLTSQNTSCRCSLHCQTHSSWWSSCWQRLRPYWSFWGCQLRSGFECLLLWVAENMRSTHGYWHSEFKSIRYKIQSVADKNISVYLEIPTSSLSKNSRTSGSCNNDGWDTILWRYLPDIVAMQNFRDKIQRGGEQLWKCLHFHENGSSFLMHRYKCGSGTWRDTCLSSPALLLSTNSTDDGSSIPTFTLVIPVDLTKSKKKKRLRITSRF